MASSGNTCAPKFDLFLNFWTILGSHPLVDFQWNKLYKALWNMCDLRMLDFAKQIELSGINWINICKAHCIMPGTQQVLYKCLTNKWEALLWTKESFIWASRKILDLKMDGSQKNRYNGVWTVDATVQLAPIIFSAHGCHIHQMLTWNSLWQCRGAESTLHLWSLSRQHCHLLVWDFG